MVGMANTRTTTGLAKEPRTGLAGPYGHPFHPLLVTLPIGAWVSSLVFDIASRVKDHGESALAYGAQWLIAIGIIGAVVAALFGLMDLMTVPGGTPARRVALTHMTLNLLTVAIFVVDFLVRRSHGYRDVPTWGIVLTVVALLILSVSGWLGGKLSYRYGVRVADEQTQAEGFREPTR
jgi:uncharacterized membrane protein